MLLEMCSFSKIDSFLGCHAVAIQNYPVAVNMVAWRLWPTSEKSRLSRVVYVGEERVACRVGVISRLLFSPSRKRVPLGKNLSHMVNTLNGKNLSHMVNTLNDNFADTVIGVASFFLAVRMRILTSDVSRSLPAHPVRLLILIVW